MAERDPNTEAREAFVREVEEIKDDCDHGISHNGNDHTQGPLANCPRCVADELTAALEQAGRALEQCRKEAHNIMAAMERNHRRALEQEREVRAFILAVAESWHGDKAAKERALAVIAGCARAGSVTTGCALASSSAASPEEKT